MTEQQLMESYIKDIIGKVKESAKQLDNVIYKMGIEYRECNFEEKSLTLAFPVQDWEVNPYNIMHGGLTTTAFDTSFGQLAHYYCNDKALNTLSLTTSYLKPVPNGETLLIKVKVDSLGNKIISMSGDGIIERTGVVAAKAITTFYVHTSKKIDYSRLFKDS